MSREEFLRGLQNALSGEVPPTVVRDNLRYYEDYIKTEIKNGRSENEVMAELGEPRLIAKTIIDTTPGGGEGGFEEYHPFSNFEYSGDSESKNESRIHYYDLNKWYWKAAGIAGLILFVMLVLMLISGFLSIMIYCLPTILLVMGIVWFFQGPRW